MAWGAWKKPGIQGYGATADVEWNFPGNTLLDDDLYADVTLSKGAAFGSGEFARWLKLRDFGHTVPTGMTVFEVEYRVNGKKANATGGYASTAAQVLIKLQPETGGPTTERTSYVLDETTDGSVWTGAFDQSDRMWGHGVMTKAEIEDVQTGLQFGATHVGTQNTDVDIFVDVIEMRVRYANVYNTNSTIDTGNTTSAEHLVAGEATVTGLGMVNGVIGDGTLLAGTATVVGTGERVVAGTGALLPDTAAVVGDGDVTPASNEVSGDGALVAGTATVVGTVERTVVQAYAANGVEAWLAGGVPAGLNDSNKGFKTIDLWTDISTGSGSITHNGAAATGFISTNNPTGTPADTGALGATITTVVGKTYLLHMQTNSVECFMRAGTTAGGSDLVDSGFPYLSKRYEKFVAVGTTTHISIGNDSTTFSSAILHIGFTALSEATIVGVGQRGVSGTGDLLSEPAAIVGAGARVVSGTGALLSGVAAIVGTGERTVTGAGTLLPDTATIAGTGERVVVGTGALLTGVAAIAGTGGLSGTVFGTGALLPDTATITGTGKRGVTATGALLPEPATVVGAGERVFTGSGALVSGIATVAGSGVTGVAGTGALVSGLATISGDGLITTTGTGAIVAGVAVVAGVGERIVTGTGALQAEVATVVGAYVPSGDLLVRLLLEDNALDSSGYGNDGTIVGTPTYETDTPHSSGKALHLNGSTDYVDLGVINVNGSGITLALWVKADSWAIGDARLISKSDGTAANKHDYMLSTIENAAIRTVRARFGQVNATYYANTAVALNTWTHVAVTYDFTTVRFYIDGVAAGTAAATDPINDRAIATYIGNQVSDGKHFDGLIDEPHIYQRALSGAEVLALMDPIDLIITGTGAIVAEPATIVGTGERTVTGTGAIVADPATIVGAGERVFTGDGALVSGLAAIVGTGARVVAGEGTLVPDAAVIAGTGTRSIAGTGALLAGSAAIVGTGERVVTGTGVLLPDTATIAGTGGLSGTVFGTGALLADTATITGTGERTVTGTGALVSEPATIVGAGLHAVTGDGELLSGTATIAGDGGVAGLITGDGTLVSELATIAGEGLVIPLSGVAGSGNIVSGPATIVGAGVRAVTGDGALLPDTATVVGIGERTVTGTGVLAANDATINGDGEVAKPTSSGDGALLPDTATVVGEGEVAKVATGALQAEAAVIVGVGTRIVTGTGALAANEATIDGSETLGYVTGDGELVAGVARIWGGYRVQPVTRGGYTVTTPKEGYVVASPKEGYAASDETVGYKAIIGSGGADYL
jgi:hypothetical protein